MLQAVNLELLGGLEIKAFYVLLLDTVGCRLHPHVPYAAPGGGGRDVIPRGGKN